MAVTMMSVDNDVGESIPAATAHVSHCGLDAAKHRRINHYPGCERVVADMEGERRLRRGRRVGCE
jgi:hypothetical protein